MKNNKQTDKTQKFLLYLFFCNDKLFNKFISYIELVLKIILLFLKFINFLIII